jgi:predicted ABC-type ATPase
VDLGLRQFVNADAIAVGLAAFAPETVAFQAGRILLARIAELARQRQDFAVETTLSSRSLAPFLRTAQHDGYTIKILYIWLKSPDLAVARVADRVRAGGHDVPEDTIRRRYWRGLSNFRSIYRPLADDWIVCDNSGSHPFLLARGGRSVSTQVINEDRYREFEAVIL